MLRGPLLQQCTHACCLKSSRNRKLCNRGIQMHTRSVSWAAKDRRAVCLKVDGRDVGGLAATLCTHPRPVSLRIIPFRLCCFSPTSLPPPSTPRPRTMHGIAA